MGSRSEMARRTALLPDSSLAPALRRALQRKCACGGNPGMDGECAACREKRLQRNTATSQPANQAGAMAPPIVHEVLRSPGQPLDPATRAFMEPRFGHDFSQVRVHTGSFAAESAAAVRASAYTVGSNLVFAQGQYSPRSVGGTKLIAHELSHVVQQSHGTIQSDSNAGLRIASSGGPAEKEAESNASRIMEGDNTATRQVASPGSVVQRAPANDAVGTAPANSVCQGVPVGIPGTYSGRHDAYAAARQCFPLNPWLPCVDRASADICRAIEAFNFRGTDGTLLEACVIASRGDRGLTRAKAAWFENTNSCIWGHWRAAMEAVNDPSRPIPPGLTPEWAAAASACRSDAGGDTCCQAQVIAEQTAIERCGSYDSAIFGKLPTDVPGTKTCSDIVLAATPGLVFTGDFGKVKDRISYGFLRCCSGL